MKFDMIKNLIGKKFKIVTVEPGEQHPTVVNGRIKEIDDESGLVFIESDQGIGCINIENIMAIKPSKKL